MCVEEEGDGKAIGGFVSSIIHQLSDCPSYLSHSAGCWETGLFSEYLFLSGSTSLSRLSSPSFSPPSLSFSPSRGWMMVRRQPRTQCIDHRCTGRADLLAVLWVEWFVQEGWSQTSESEAGVWQHLSKSFCWFWSAEKRGQSSPHCRASHTPDE